MKKSLLSSFAATFGDSGGAKTYFAPGRVNLIGEHTDYNGGHVFPCALTMGTYGVARRRDDDRLRFYSLNMPEQGIIEASVDDLRVGALDKKKDWANYPLGVVWAFGASGHTIAQGFDLLIDGSIPNGAGLSSSASLEVLTAYILRDLFALPVTNQELALLGQKAENEYIGVNCGIMDQFAIAMGRAGHAIFLDTADLSHTYAPLDLAGAKIVIANSNKKRGLADSKYNERRSECEQALAELQTVIPVSSLGDLSEEDFEKHKSAIKDEVCMRRARHAVYENRRTIRAVAALKAGDIDSFGQLMNQSHISLRDDYTVTGAELDALVGEAWQAEGVIGSRMTGAGFGGCTVSIVREEAVPDFISTVGLAYQAKTGLTADFYIVETSGGPCEL